MEKIEYTNKLYFISERKIENNILYPRIPNNYFTENKYEDDKHKRVCLCKNVEKCLTALSKNCKDLLFYVYVVEDTSKYQIYKPNTKEVPDSKITEELWILTPVKIKLIGRIKCNDAKENEEYIFNYDNKTARLYDWDYEWL